MESSESPILWIVNPLKQTIVKPNDQNETKYNEKYNYNFSEDYNDFSIPQPSNGRKRSPSFMKSMFSHS